jgi:hypothetical protein
MPSFGVLGERQRGGAGAVCGRPMTVTVDESVEAETPATVH